MKQWLLSLSLLLTCAFPSLTFALSIVSDLDDTIRIIDVNNPLNAARRGIFSDDVYAGMPFLLNQLHPQSLSIVSGSPKIIARIIHEVLEDNGLSNYQLILKDQSSTTLFKLATLRQILSRSTDSFLLFGDDTEADPEIYTQIKKEFPQKILAIYIHSIKGKKYSSPIQSFITSYEVAFEENMQGRFSTNDLFTLERILITSKSDHLIPKFASCALWPEQSKKISFNLERYVDSICESRQDD